MVEPVCYHGQEYSKFGIHVNHVAVHENKRFLLLLFTIQDQSNLLGSNGQHWQFDSVELVEAAPRSRLGQPFSDKCKTLLKSKHFISLHSELIATFENSTKAPVVHLIRTIENHDVFSQGLSHVLGCFSFACASWPRRATSHAHAESLGQRYVAPSEIKDPACEYVSNHAIRNYCHHLSVNGVMTRRSVQPRNSFW